MSAWRQSLERIGLRFPPGAGGFLRWWQGALLAWLPPRWQWQLGFAPSRLLLAREGESLALARQRELAPEPLAQLPWPLAPQELDALLPSRLQAMPRHWLLPPQLALRRPLRLPAAATARLRDVARFEIDRQTPFESEQVWFDVRVRGKYGDDQLDAELVVVPKRALDGPQGVPVAWRDQLAGVDVADGHGEPLRINLLPEAQRKTRGDPFAGWNLLLWVFGLLALSAAARWVLDNRNAAADALQAQVQASAQRARAVATQRQQLLDLIDGAAFFEQQRAARPAAIEVWNELSRRLPDGTYLEKFSMEGDELQLIGLSSEASSLVERLEGAPTWRTPSLSGVLQSDSGQGRDRFTMTATLAPAAVPAARPATPAADAPATTRRRAAMNAAPDSRERLWALALLLLAIAGVYLLVVHPFFVQPLLATQNRIEALQLRDQRIRAELLQAPKVAEQLQRARAELASRPGFLPEATAELATAGLVQRLESVVAQASPGHRSCAISNRSPLPPDTQNRFTRVSVQVRLRCGTPELAAVLHALESGAPRLFVDNLNVLAQRAQLSPNEVGSGLDVTLELSGYVRPNAGAAPTPVTPDAPSSGGPDAT